MARVKFNKTKLDSIYWYKQGSKKKFAYRYKYYDQHDVRREKSTQGFDTIEAAERDIRRFKCYELETYLRKKSYLCDGKIHIEYNRESKS